MLLKYLYVSNQVFVSLHAASSNEEGEEPTKKQKNPTEKLKEFNKKGKEPIELGKDYQDSWLEFYNGKYKEG